MHPTLVMLLSKLCCKHGKIYCHHLPPCVYIQNKQEHREAADPHSHTVQAGSNQVDFCMAIRVKAASNASIHKLLSKAVKVMLAYKTAPGRSSLYRSPLQLGSHQSSALNGLVRHATWHMLWIWRQLIWPHWGTFIALKMGCHMCCVGQLDKYNYTAQQILCRNMSARLYSTNNTDLCGWCLQDGD